MGGKRKKSKGGAADWSHDGGTELEDGKSVVRAGPRKTQERDERFRRGRLKMQSQKNKRLFERKMANRVHFTAPAPVSDLPVVEEGPPKRPSQVRNKSSLSVLQRFQSFLRSGPTLDAEEDSDDDDDDEDDDEEDEDEEEDVEDDKDEEEDEQEEEEEEEEEEEKRLAKDGGLDEGDFSGEDIDEGNAPQGPSNTPAPFDWFFSAATTLRDKVQTKQHLVKECEGFSFFRSCSEPSLPQQRWNSLGDVSTLPKLWWPRKSTPLAPLPSLLLPYLSTYCDVFVDGRDHHNDDLLLRSVLLHSCIHAFHARSAVQKNNTGLKKKQMAAIGGIGVAKKKDLAKEENEEGYQDQGFTRPRVLILCPFRGVALKCLEMILEIYGDKTSVANLDKFQEEYGPPDFSDDENDDSDGGVDGQDEEENDESDNPGEKMSRRRKEKEKPTTTASKRKRQKKPPTGEKQDDWKADFRQNIDDDFKIGIQVNPGHGKGSGTDKGVYLRLYSDFMISDIILASPLGLRFAIENGSKGCADFLSSIEIVVMHQAEAMYMQNWDHVDFIFKNVNKLPTTNSEIDFSRVRPYFLDGLGSHHRQLIVTSSFNEPSIQACFREHGQSIAGSLRVCKNWRDGEISNVMRRMNQVFQRVHSDEFRNHEDDRFAYFKDAVLGPLLRTNQKRTIIFTPSYFNFVRVRNELMRQEANAAFICEYSRESEISRGRSRFFHGTKDILLYSGRFHYFRRYCMRGANHIIFYSLPEFPQYYPELVNLVTDSGASSDTASCLALFTKYERLALERIVGKKCANHLLTSEKSTFMFK